MQFLIHGADHKTGREMTIVVDARDRVEAVQRVLYNDILVSSISRFIQEQPQREAKVKRGGSEDAETALDYNAPETPPQAQQPHSRPPFYRQILTGARALRSLSLAICGVGLVLVVASLLAAALPWCGTLHIYLPFTVAPALCYLAAGALAVMGLVCACCAAPLWMMSEIALAVRDLARNSFDESRAAVASSSEASRTNAKRLAAADEHPATADDGVPRQLRASAEAGLARFGAAGCATA